MLLIRSEQCRQFDTYVGNVETAMKHPDMVRVLGDMASKVADINSRAFLPNIRHERLVIPRKYRGDLTAPALLPVGRADAGSADALVGNILETEYGRLKILGSTAVSTLSGATMSQEELIGQVSSGDVEKLKPLTGTTEMTVARTVIGCKTLRFGDRENLYYAGSRPYVTVVSDELDGRDMWNQTGIVGHEWVHALDSNEHPLFYHTLRGSVASEFVAYRFSDTVFDMTDQPFAPQSHAYEVEEWRRSNLGIDGYVAADAQLPGLLDMMNCRD